MAAQRREEAQRARRRKRLIRGLLVGAAAVGLPALANLLVSRRARRLSPTHWGSGDRYAWRHGEIAFQRLGEGSPLLLLHSFGPGHSSAEWRWAAEALAGGHHVHAPDLLGWGHSEMPVRSYEPGLYLRLVADFLRDVVPLPAAVVAAGSSAPYAVRLAAERPEWVSGLALVAPAGLGDGRSEGELKDLAVHRLLRLPVLGTAALNLYTSRAALASYLRREVYANPQEVDEELVDRHYRLSHRPGAGAALAAYLSGLLDCPLGSDILERVEAPVWIAWGRQAVSPPIEAADLWLQSFPDAELEVFERCGALPHAEWPAELAEKLEQFLTGLRR